MSMELPDEADVEIDLCDTSGFDIAPDRAAFHHAGPSAKKLYKWLIGVSGGNSVVSIDPISAEHELGMVPISLGKTLSSLEKLGLIEIMKKQKAQSSKVVLYKIKILDDNQEVYDVATAATPWEDTVGDIDATLGKSSRALYEALFKMADLDGNIVGRTKREVVWEIRPMPERFPLEELSSLEDCEYISVSSGMDPLNISIIGYTVLRKAVESDG